MNLKIMYDFGFGHVATSFERIIFYLSMVDSAVIVGIWLESNLHTWTRSRPMRLPSQTEPWETCTYEQLKGPRRGVPSGSWLIISYTKSFLTFNKHVRTHDLILKSYWFAICDTYTRLEAWPRSTVHDHGGSTFSVKFRTSKIKSCIQLKQFKKQFGLQFTVHLKPGSHLLLATQIMARMHVLFNRF